MSDPAGDGMQWWVWPLAVAFVAAIVLVVAVQYGSQREGINPDRPSDPVALLASLFRGELVWPVTATWILSGIGAVVVAFTALIVWARMSGRKGRKTCDHAIAHTAGPEELRGLQRKQGLKKSARLGVAGSPGVPVGRMAPSGMHLYGSFEDMTTLIAGPRTGKSTSFVIPAIMQAPGAVVTTSNKRDVLDATRDLRAQAGDVWVFDPQKVAGEKATWWWNPLSYVTDDTKAAKLAQHFASSMLSGAGNGGNDGFWERRGKNLLANFLLAAAVGNRPITDVYEWLTNQARTEAVDYLLAAGYTRQADAVNFDQQSEEKIRNGVYSTAEGMASCLGNTGIEEWVNPVRAPYAPRRRFDPHEFVRGSGTLYSLSREGAGTAGPLVTALTAATIEAAEELATASPGGRLQTPMLGILDEAANVCRWSDLPDLYSHFGSRGIPIMAAFQSWSQGVAVFGEKGMDKLWSAANMRIYGGGVAEVGFLSNLSDLVGTYDRRSRSVSTNKGVRSTSDSIKRDKILDVQELADLPRGRAVLLSSGNRAALLATVPWYQDPDKKKVAAIKASIAAHEPGGRAA
ncbi:type IV secretory system conjugative DNA transfer family protein (plasmid) [Rathayibacter sp. VKM Ac-2759]|uniref:type IV secretory system conjugative DNA transfer family protein n=1 Tax=Rathayibacter sp. VKM Ac-2759 TaxID=2609252 RepID=UPI0013194C3D|nr:TraM recognition domain-containing protein [Rathayibacter sp. VKM Ac-2759]QHC68854.1 type IV secretory system conjugative DNA transfer family protein [Rathayibacter sp. VKM Ac-2759]